MTADDEHAPPSEWNADDLKDGLRDMFTKKRIWFTLALLALAIGAGLVLAALRFARKI